MFITDRSEDGQPLIRNHHSGPVPLIRQRLPQAIESSNDDDWTGVLTEYFYNSNVPTKTIISTDGRSTDDEANNWHQDSDHYNLIGTAFTKSDDEQNNYYRNDGKLLKSDDDDVNSEYSSYQSTDSDEFNSQSAADTYLSFLAQISQLRSRQR